MPDRDNLPKSLPKAWQDAQHRAQCGPEHLAEWAAYKIVTKELPKLEGRALFDVLVKQLKQIADTPPTERTAALLEMPVSAAKSRVSQTILNAAERLAVELALEPDAPFSLGELQTKLAEAYCIEIFRVNCCGPLEMRGAGPEYTSIEETQALLRETEAILREKLAETMMALAADPLEPSLPKLKEPKKPKRTQEELVRQKVRMNSAALLGLLSEEDE